MIPTGPYRFPDTMAITRYIEENLHPDDKDCFDMSLFSRRIEDLSKNHFSKKEKSAEEIKDLVSAFFKDFPPFISKQNTSFPETISLDIADDETINHFTELFVNCTLTSPNKKNKKEELDKISLIRVANPNIYNASHSDLYIAVDQGLFQEAEKIVENRPKLLNSKTSYGTTPLVNAAFKGNLKIVQFLLNAGADIQERDIDGFTALDYAVFNNHFDIASKIIERKGSLSFDQISKGPLLYQACKNLNEKMISLLLETGIIISIQQGYHALKEATLQEHIPLMTLLIAYNAPFSDKNLDPMLIVAANSNKLLSMQALLSFGMNIDQQNQNGYTALICAVEHGHVEAVKLLLSRNANVNLKRMCGLTALHAAAWRGNLEIISLLIERGAKVNMQDWSGLTPLKYASTDAAKMLLAN
jgi:ankyrin repeat protein